MLQAVSRVDELPQGYNTMSHAILRTEHRIYVAGHRGMVGSAILRRLNALGFHHIITRSHAELDLTDQASVRAFLQREKPDHVVLAAARVGGIQANNTYPAEFIHQNLAIQLNVIHEAYAAGIQRLLFLGSSCIYPKFADQPLAEASLLTGQLEPTNEPYAIAKIAGIKLCESYNRQYGTHYRSVMPTNLYGPGDSFDLENSHVLPALLRKFHLAKLAMQGEQPAIIADEARFGPIPADFRAELTKALSGDIPEVPVWGTGQVRREFLHVDDLAAACLHVMNLTDEQLNATVSPMCSHLNVGAGIDWSIKELVDRIIATVGYRGRIRYLIDKPEGTPRKLLDVSQLNRLGWTSAISFKEGLAETYRWYDNPIDSEPG